METKNKRTMLERIRRSLSFSNSCYVDLIGSSGGLALWWMDRFVLDVRSKSPNILRCIISPFAGRCWAASFIYTPPCRRELRAFWHYLRGVAAEMHYPWLCVGDFNQVGSIFEKQGGRECQVSQLCKFQELISDCNLTDLGFQGNAFTWSNHQKSAGNVRERLDRALATIDWQDLFPQVQVFHEICFGSDHCPLIINYCVPSARVPRQFKFESLWTTSPGCVAIIHSEWEREQVGSHMFQLVQRLKRSQRRFWAWSSREFGNGKRRINDLRGQIAQVQSHPYSSDVEVRYKQLAHELELVLQREEIKGEDMDSALDVVHNVISSTMNASLIQAVSDEEIKLAAFQLGSLKAPGPDGYPGYFYHWHWDIVGPSLCAAVKSFFRGGFLLKEMNHTNLVLIPKVPAPETLSQFRPISLCNFNIKVITKILANRLKGVLSEVVSPN
ncbi:uncharacterized protein LOC114283052 [Camellia sinensis]|uniref:uncharacterized protein LOC114283052 n=1 Tax=Camellia sinensis TaxID=4442 RepID=UPI0010367661|nr:uncharacterized protein LOC114283052 [Camellia sinensis]